TPGRSTPHCRGRSNLSTSCWVRWPHGARRTQARTWNGSRTIRRSRSRIGTSAAASGSTDMEPRRDYAVFEDVKIHYVTAGEGFPVVLLHGFPQTWREWRRILPGLVAAGYAAIAPDLRGL